MIDLAAYGYPPIEEPEEGLLPARVTAVHRERCELVCVHGPVFGRLKTGVYYGPEAVDFPTTGDFVLLRYVRDGDSVIVKTLPRRSVFVRSDYSGHKAGYAKTILEQAVAANFDTIMTSLNQNFNPSRLERYLTLAWQSGAAPVILLTKVDLVEDFAAQVRTAREIAMGVEVIALSAVTGFGLERLGPYLQPGITIVFLGSSGVGKSSLLNALMGETAMAVSEIREGDSREVHHHAQAAVHATRRGHGDRYPRHARDWHVGREHGPGRRLRRRGGGSGPAVQIQRLQARERAGLRGEGSP